MNATYNENEYRYEYDIEDLASDLNIAVSAVAKPTIEIAMSCNYPDALNIEIIDQENDNLCQLDEDGKVNLRSEKTYRMYINNRVPEVYSFKSIILDDTTEYIIDAYGDNYIEFANPTNNHTVAITLDKKPSDTIKVNRNGDLVWTRLYKIDGDWYWIYNKSDTKSEIEWEVLTNQKYRLELGVENPLIYEITSVIIDKDTDGEADITENFTDAKDDNDYIEFEDISTNHTIDVVAAKQGETKQFTLEAFFDNGNDEESTWYGNYSDFELYDPAKETTIGVGDSFELLTGSTTRLMIKPHLGYKVKTIMVDEVDVTETFNACDGYYEFADLDADHSIKVVFEEATTHYFIVTSNEEEGWFALEAKGSNYYREYNTELNFNEGIDVTMRVNAQFWKQDKGNNSKIEYKLTKIMDGETDITPSTTNQDNQYEVSFDNLSANHNVSLTYEPITYYNVTVKYDDSWHNIRAYLNNNWAENGREYQFVEGSDVRLTLNIPQGIIVTSIKDGEEIIKDTNNNPITNNVEFKNLNRDIVITVNSETVPTYYIDTEFSGYSQATVYMESDLFEKHKTNGDNFNAGSDVTVTIVPSIGYEVSELVLINNNTDEATNVEADYDEESKEYRYVIENLGNDYHLIITTAKKSMTGIDDQLYTLNENGIGTYCSEYDLDFSEVEGITAYIASGFDPIEGFVVLTKVFKVPAGTGIIIKGTPDNYRIPVKATNFFYRNMLVGTITETPIEETEWKDVEYTNYILLKKDTDTEPTFYRAEKGNMPANRAYLQIPSNLVPSANNARITTVFDDEVTPVEDILTNTDNPNVDFYNLNGQKVQTMKKGVYIKNGKKVIIR